MKLGQVLKDILYLFNEIIFFLPYLIFLFYFTGLIAQWHLIFLLIIISMWAGFAVSRLMSRRNFLLRLLTAVPFIVFIGLFSHNSQYSAAIITAILLPFFIWGIKIPSMHYDTLFSAIRMLFGFISYIACYILVYSMKTLVICRPFIAVGGTIYFVFSMFVINRNRLLDAVIIRKSGDGKLPLAVTLNNVLMTVLFLTVTAFVVNINELKKAFAIIIAGIYKGIMILIDLYARLFSHSKIDQGPGMGDQPLSSALKTAKHTTGWFETLAYYFFLALLILLIIGLLYFIVKKVYAFVKIMIQFIRDYLSRWRNSGIQEYTDENESLFTWNRIQKDFMTNVQQWWNDHFYHDVKWEDIKSNQERIRYLYRQMLRNLFKTHFPLYKTPNEIRNNDESIPLENRRAVKGIVDAYNIARFSNHVIDDDLVVKTQNEVESLKKNRTR